MLRQQALKEWNTLKGKITSFKNTKQTFAGLSKELDAIDQENMSGEYEEIKKKKNDKKNDLFWKKFQKKPESIFLAIEQNEELNYLYSLKTSLEERAKENKQYEDRLRQVEERNNKLGSKLEWAKGLLADGKIERLKQLVKSGKI